MHYRLRSFLRVSTDAKITITARDFSLTSTLSDLSLGGVFVLSKEQVPVVTGDVLKLNIHLPVDSEDTCLLVNGMVVRINENGIAFRFIETGSDALR